MNQIFNSDYTFQSQYAGFRATKIYPKLAHCFEVLESFSDFDELKDDYADVPYADKAGVDAVLTFVTDIDKHTLRPLKENHKRVVKLQVKTIRADKTAKFGHNITVATSDLKHLSNVDLYVQIFERVGQEPDYVVVDAVALRDFISSNLPTIDRDFSRNQSYHSRDRFYFIPVEQRKYRPSVAGDGITENQRFGLPGNSIMLCSENLFNIICCAKFGVTELKISRKGE